VAPGAGAGIPQARASPHGLGTPAVTSRLLYGVGLAAISRPWPS